MATGTRGNGDAMKILETLNNVALAFVALPESIREARAILAEQRDEADDLERLGRLDRYNRELECQRSERANAHSAALEKLRDKIAELEASNSKGNAGFAELMNANSVLQFQVSSGLKSIADLESELATMREKYNALAFTVPEREDQMRAKPEPSIPEPDPGEGFELCTQDTATHVCFRGAPLPDGTSTRFHNWVALTRVDFAPPSSDHRFRRPIAKPAPQWVACTAKEAADNLSDSQGLGRGEWRDCAKEPLTVVGQGFAFRTTAALSEWVEVTGETLKDFSPDINCTTVRVGPIAWDKFHVRRAEVPVGTVLG